MTGLPTIIGGDVVLRALRPADARAVLAIFGDARVTRMMAMRTLADESDAVALIQEIQSLARHGTLMQWGVVLPTADQPVGTVTLASIDRASQRAELGVGLAHAYWGQGLAARATRTLLDHAFRTMSLHRLEADVDAENGAAIRLLENLGFEREGVLRERWLVDGEWHDSIWLGLLADRWRAGRA
jgi:RimJ/RimL family protein N-acetyltransferase